MATRDILWDLDYVVYAAGFSVEHTERAIVVSGAEGDAEFLGLFSDAKQAKAALEEAALRNPGRTARIYSTTYLEDEAASRAFHNAKSMVEGHFRIVEGRLRKAGHQLGEVSYLLTGKTNFRDQIATIRPYKGNRDLSPRPVLYRQIREYLVSYFGARIVEGWEADDEIAELAARSLHTAVVVHVDKDLNQIPGSHYRPTDGGEFYKVSPAQARRFLYRQAITGDPVDNIGGVYKGGKRLAEEAIPDDMEDARRMWEAVVGCYEASIARYGDATRYAHLGAEAAATENMRLVYLRRSQDDRWSPPTSSSGGI